MMSRRNDIFDKKLDKLMNEAASLAVEKLAEDIPEPTEKHTFSELHEAKMRKVFAQSERKVPLYQRITKYGSVAAAAVLLVVTAATVTITVPLDSEIPDYDYDYTAPAGVYAEIQSLDEFEYGVGEVEPTIWGEVDNGDVVTRARTFVDDSALHRETVTQAASYEARVEFGGADERSELRLPNLQNLWTLDVTGDRGGEASEVPPTTMPIEPPTVSDDSAAPALTDSAQSSVLNGAADESAPSSLLTGGANMPGSGGFSADSAPMSQLPAECDNDNCDCDDCDGEDCECEN